MKHEHFGHHGDSHSEVLVSASYTSGKITVKVRDMDDMVLSLEETHGKRMHLVIISADFETFLHVHPSETHSGDFEVELDLPPGRYMAFVDINPNLPYAIEPLTLTVGSPIDLPPIDWDFLAKGDFRIKESAGKTVRLQHPELIAGKPATLTFDLNGEHPLPYLGALGHVVVVDGQGSQFIHVHPVSENQTVFEAQFPSSGFYKLWAEFKFTDTGVLAFPFILKVAERS